MKKEFNYLENVVVNTEDPEFLEINNKVGTIIGLPDTDDKERIYTIYFVHSDDVSYSIPARYLISTGQFEDEKTIYPD